MRPLAIPFLLSLATSQAPVLVQDLDTRPPVGGSYPSEIVTLTNGDVLFAAFVSQHRRGLFRSVQGTGTPQLWQDFEDPQRLTSLGPWAILGTADGVWAIDGTIAGTRLLLGPGSIGPFTEFVPFGSRTLFLGDQLYVSNGTVNGTTGLLRFDSRLQAASHPVVAGTQAFFTMLNANVRELWRTDGTAAGTFRVAGIPARPMTALGSRMLLEVVDNTGDKSFWISDGTPAGTVLLVDVDGARPNAARHLDVAGSRANTVVFGTQSATGAEELWQTDGTPAGTSRLAALPGRVRRTATAGNLLYFACDNQPRTELWRTDGTAAGTYQLRAFAIMDDMVTDGPRLIFSAAAVGMPDLWVSDGTVNGTTVLRTGGHPSAFASLRPGRIWFRMESGNIGSELWETDGTRAGTRLFADIPSRERTLSSWFAQSTASAGLGLYQVFRSRPVGHIAVNTQVVFSDGTAQGTFATGLDLPQGHSTEIGRLGGTMLFRGEEPTRGSELYGTDGTRAGTRLIKDIHPNGSFAKSSSPAHFVQLGGAVYFTAFGPNQGRELWRTDGLGASLVRDLYPGTESGVSSALLHWRDRLYFVGSDGTRREIHSTDGSASFAVLDGARAPTPWILHSDASLTGTADRLFFWASSTGRGVELWSSDGTIAGTSMTRDIAAGVADSYVPGRAVARGATLFFVAWTAANGAELWRSDGTAAGTTLVRDVRPGAEDAGIRELTLAGDTLFFVADDGTTGPELWRSDGTTAGTTLVRDIDPGPAGGLRWRGAWVAPTLTAVGDRVYFAAYEPTAGNELWVSDGTAAGTRRVVDFNPGPLGSYPAGLQVVRGSLLFHADDGVLGTELWRLPLDASAEPLGPGCAIGAPPTLAATPPRLGNAVTLRVAAPRGSNGVLVIGVRFAYPTHIGSGCEVFPDLAAPFVSLPFGLSAQGTWTVQVAVPNLPSLAGALLPMQAGVGPTARLPLGLDLTNAVLLAPR